jgi:hypothetical protein
MDGSMVEQSEREKVGHTLVKLSSSDLTYLCHIFMLPARGGIKEKVIRLLNQDKTRYERLLSFARLVELGYHAEGYLGKGQLRTLLAKNNLPISGNRHRLFLTLIENGKLSVSEILGLLNPKGLRQVYTGLFDKPALDSETELRYEIENWVNEKLLGEPPLRTLEQLAIWQPMEAGASSAKEFDVAISYASEDVDVAKELAERLKRERISVFFDEFFKADMWGKSLSTRFKQAFGARTEFVLVLVSKHYVVKDWTDFEFLIARGEARTREEEFILPIRLDDTPMAGLKSDVCYMDLRKDPIDGIVRDFKKKLEDRHRSKEAVTPNPFQRLIRH